MKSIIRILTFVLISFVLFLTACENILHSPTKNQIQSTVILTEKTDIGAMLDSFNIAAANANYEQYFDFFADESTFIGTDATEVWNKQQFMTWAKPFFAKKKTWHFKSIDRHIYFGKDNSFAWFDELLDTQMKICRGSGVVEKINDKWKIKQYVLSMTIPNKLSDQITTLKSPIEDSLIQHLSSH
jgi:hypothetical protein